jgi:hypothetical protein
MGELCSEISANRSCANDENLHNWWLREFDAACVPMDWFYSSRPGRDISSRIASCGDLLR